MTTDERLAALEAKVDRLLGLIDRLLEEFGPILAKYRTKAAVGAARWSNRVGNHTLRKD